MEMNQKVVKLENIWQPVVKILNVGNIPSDRIQITRQDRKDVYSSLDFNRDGEIVPTPVLLYV